VADRVRVRARRADPMGHVVLRDWHSDHSRGLNGFDPELHVAGLDAALSTPDARRSAYVWNRLLSPRADQLRGTVESASRQDYSNSRCRDQDTEPHRLATDQAWLPTPDGAYTTPRELRLDDLPPDFLRHNGLADALGMITSVVQQASTKLGIPVALLLYLADNPHAVTDLARTAGTALAAPTVLPGVEDADECGVGDGDVGGVGKPRGRVAGGAFVGVVSGVVGMVPGLVVEDLGDGGAGGGFVDDGFVGGEGGDEGL
jgi:hypothetical protein